MFRFLETDKENKNKYVKRIQTSVDNKIYDLHYEIEFEDRVKDKHLTFFLIETLLFFYKQKYILFLET